MNLEFLSIYKDKNHYDFWKYKAVDLNILLFNKLEELIIA